MQTAGLVVAAAPLVATLATVPAANSAAAAAGTDTGEGVTFADGPRQLVRYPGKRPLIRVTARPPHLETPFSVFNEGPITANDAFFVRYHLANIPLSIDPAPYRLAVQGLVNSPLSLSLAELKALAQPTEVIAVNQCSGNSRGFSAPRVFGAQLANGAMGNARWVGVPLRKVLEKAGVGAGARQVTFNGLDTPILPSTPDFRKALDIDHALSGEPLLAWSMNGKDIPFLNGYPVKLIVPGYFGTYWVKHLSEIEVIDHTFDGHDAAFMTTA
jgi:DMSO/TMAO reductase YedYZ molybdopterin-dependent catalytic subunit